VDYSSSETKTIAALLLFLARSHSLCAEYQRNYTLPCRNTK